MVCHRSAVRSYLALVGSAELAPHFPARLEVARKVATMHQRSAARSYLALVGCGAQGYVGLAVFMRDYVG